MRNIVEKYFKPKKYVKDIFDLKNQNLNKDYDLILFDLDNTLDSHNASHPSKKQKNFIDELLNQGLKVHLISNNKSKRVEIYAKELNVPFISNAKKPTKLGYKKVMKLYPEISKSRVLTVGDQIMTDALGAARFGIDMYKVQQFETGDLVVTKINRKLEKIVMNYMEKKNIYSEN